MSETHSRKILLLAALGVIASLIPNAGELVESHHAGGEANQVKVKFFAPLLAIVVVTTCIIALEEI